MKAKELAKLLNDATPDDKMIAMRQVCEDFLKQFDTLFKQRKIQSGSSLWALVEELDKKWLAMARQVHKWVVNYGIEKEMGVIPDGFLKLIEKQLPIGLYEKVKQIAKERREIERQNATRR